MKFKLFINNRFLNYRYRWLPWQPSNLELICILIIGACIAALVAELDPNNW